ncbi:MAG: hypothetical protein NDI61_13250 [Bdellovibrionaceae bacterium]|nr:hypothetical protein [Pseudobdellovibrionaceae bacterium]
MMRRIRSERRNFSIILLLATVSVALYQNCSPGFSPSSHSANGDWSSQEPSATDPSDTPFDVPPSDNSANPTPIDPPIELADTIDRDAPSCRLAAYTNWKCLSTQLRSAEGLVYSLEFRWNRVATPSQGTVLWVNGNHGNAPFRSASTEARAIQDRLDRESGVRSVEVIFSDPVLPTNPNSGGYWKYPRGYYSAASAYFAALQFVATQGLKRGLFLNHIGVSNGTMVAAYALSNLNAGQYLDRVIFSAGPFLSDVSLACRADHYASFNQSPTQFSYIKSLLNYWSSGDAAKDICSLAPDRSSLLKLGNKRFPKTAVHVFMGAKEDPEGFGPWILNSNVEWFSAIEAPEKSREVVSTMGHEFISTGIYDLARRPAPIPLDGTIPTFLLSLTLNGPPTLSIPLDRKIYGTVTGMSDSAFSCSEEFGSSYCVNPMNWTLMPNAEWSYVDGKWRGEFTLSSGAVRSGQRFSSFWYDRKTGKRSGVRTFEVTP